MRFQAVVKWAMYLLLVAFACYAVFLHFYNQNTLTKLCDEDGIIEWLTAIFYFLASFIFIYACKKQGLKNVWYWGLSILFFAVAGEEISWGQRIFEIPTPELLLNTNIQQEINLHNIKVIHGNIRAIGLLVILGICYLIPLTNKVVGWLQSYYRRTRMPIFPLWMIGIPTVGILFMAIPRLLFHQIIFNLDEIGEIYLSLGFLLFSISEFSINRKL